jgi:hypothetical protein
LRQDVNRGKGASVRLGMLEARGELVLFTDADLSTPLDELGTLEAAVAAGAHVAIGSRGIDRTMIERRQGLGREVSGRAFNWLVRCLLLDDIRDTQCGFKLRQHCVRPIFTRQRILRFGFDVEILAIARALSSSSQSVPSAGATTRTRGLILAACSRVSRPARAWTATRHYEQPAPAASKRCADVLTGGLP